MDDDEKQWLKWQRDDVIRILRYRGWDPAEARAVMDGISDEVFQIIRYQAVNELAETYILGMRSTIRIREALAYSKSMYPEDTERSKAAAQARREAWARIR